MKLYYRTKQQKSTMLLRKTSIETLNNEHEIQKKTVENSGKVVNLGGQNSEDEEGFELL